MTQRAEASQDETDQAHGQKRTETRQIARGCVSVEVALKVAAAAKKAFVMPASG
jgi:hypothetical protein